MDALERNQTIKNYIQTLFVNEEESLKFARQNSLAQGMPDIHVPPHVGKFISLLTKIRSPKKALEIGALGGYSTLWIARGLAPRGRLISLELEPKHASIAKEHIHNAGYEDQVEFLVGNASDLLSAMIRDEEEPFDLIFIDADKENYPIYLELAISLAKTGTLIISDNLIPKGEEIDNPHPNNHEACAIYQFNRLLAGNHRLETVLATTIVGEKGRVDALGISLVIR